MVKRGINEFKVGIFVTGGLFLAMLMIFMAGGEHKLFERNYTLYASFEDISGLRIGAQVQLSGYKIGFVDKLKFQKEGDKTMITVVMRLKKRFQELIRTDSIATIETQGLLGDKFIYISAGSEAQPVIPDKGIVVSKQTTSIFSLAEKAGSIMDNLDDAAKTISSVLTSTKGTKGEGDLKATISSIRKTVEAVENGNGLVHAMIFDPNGKEVVSNLSATMKAVKEISVGAEKGSKDKMGGLIANMRNVSANLKVVMERIKDGDGTLGRLINDPALYDDVRAILGRANRNKLMRAVIRSTLKENDKRELK